jgi:hypothetical protein
MILRMVGRMCPHQCSNRRSDPSLRLLGWVYGDWP